MLIHDIIVTSYYVIYYNVMVNILMYYSNTPIVNMYSLYRKLVYKIIVNRCGYRITYSMASCMSKQEKVLFLASSKRQAEY